MFWHVAFKLRPAPRSRRRSGSTKLLAVEREAFEEAEALLVEAAVGRLPVDPVPVAKALGIRVLSVAMAREVSGALVKQVGQDPAILLNVNDSRSRQRFTCGREIGHFVRRSAEPDAYEYVDYREALSSAGLEEEEERYANAFASALLMPAPDVCELHACRLGEVGMLMCFGVPREAMRYRWDSLGLS